MMESRRVEEAYGYGGIDATDIDAGRFEFLEVGSFCRDNTHSMSFR